MAGLRYHPTGGGNRPSGGEPAGEPAHGQLGHLFQGPWLLKEMAGARDDLQARLAPEPAQGGPVELQHLRVEGADDEQGRRSHPAKGGPGQVRPATPGHHRGDPLWALGRGQQPPGQQLNVEAEAAAGAVGGFLFEGEQVEQEGVEAGPAEEAATCRLRGL